MIRRLRDRWWKFRVEHGWLAEALDFGEKHPEQSPVQRLLRWAPAQHHPRCISHLCDCHTRHAIDQARRDIDQVKRDRAEADISAVADAVREGRK